MKIDNNILIPELGRLMSEGKEVRFTPSGVSMRPFIEGDRDSVVLAQYGERQPRRGDVVLAKIKTIDGRETYVLHRLIRIEKDGSFVLQGDGNLQGEEHCAADGLIGYVLHVESPKGRRKPLTKGYLWHWMLPVRRWLLKIYRHTILIWFYENN